MAHPCPCRLHRGVWPSTRFRPAGRPVAWISRRHWHWQLYRVISQRTSRPMTPRTAHPMPRRTGRRPLGAEEVPAGAGVAPGAAIAAPALHTRRATRCARPAGTAAAPLLPPLHRAAPCMSCTLLGLVGHLHAVAPAAAPGAGSVDGPDSPAWSVRGGTTPQLQCSAPVQPASLKQRSPPSTRSRPPACRPRSSGAARASMSASSSCGAWCPTPSAPTRPRSWRR
jgi:hypothetical protein